MVTLPAEITWTVYLRHVKGHGTYMNFHIKTWVREDLLFMLLALEVHGRKTYFLQYHICINFICHIVPVITLARFGIVTQSRAR